MPEQEDRKNGGAEETEFPQQLQIIIVRKRGILLHVRDAKQPSVDHECSTARSPDRIHMELLDRRIPEAKAHIGWVND
jgi:hypothetical protein